ncbi:MAG: glycine-rich domain-containing protein-like [Myxococcaceae bacterium]|nr:MAG: glycine-rich domain-containing protein-like [Myxococcaceae bacterium]
MNISMETSPALPDSLLPTRFPLLSVDLIRSSYRSEDFPADWTDAQRRHSLDRYEKWLLLKVKHPDARLAPTRDIDRFWHLHMLSPVAYVNDCQRLFGQLLDHDGGFGHDPAELPELKRVFRETATLWEAAYEQPYREDGRWEHDETALTSCWHNCSNRCWHACSGK